MPGVTMTAAGAIVHARGISKRFGGIAALTDVSIELCEGEIHALVGENGSGKSTLGNVLAGALKPDAGEVFIDGQPVRLHSPSDALDRGIVQISQELTLAPTITVTENILLGRLPRRGPIVRWAAARRAARTALDDLEVDVDERELVAELPIEARQEVEIARAFSTPARVMIVDEGTSSLSEQATKRVLERLEARRQEGTAVLFVSHRLPEIYACATRATVLRDGKRVGVCDLANTPSRTLVHRMVGREIDDLYGKREIPKGSPAMQVSELTTEDGSVLDVSLEVAAGEILGIAGLVGSGKSDVGLALAGALPATGTVVVNGSAVSLRDPRAAIDAGIAYVPEDRKRSALLPTRTTGHNLSIAWSDRLSRAGIVPPGPEQSAVEESMERFRVHASSPRQPVVELSGGNQQKVVLARLFAGDPKVVILSEPTRGIDIGAKGEVYRFIQEIAGRGAGVVVISSELPELLGVSDRVLVMWRGRLVAEFDRESATERKIAEFAFGADDLELAS